MNKDVLTTVLGGLAAATAAAQPVISAAEGSLHKQDYFQLVFAVLMAVFSYFTNKKEA